MLTLRGCDPRVGRMNGGLRAESVVVALAALLAARAATVMGQGYEWLPGEGMAGVDGEVCAMTTWDPDGPGPDPEMLFVGGYFTVAGQVLADNIARWTGTAFKELGAGVDGRVRALAVYNGELIAGGDFYRAGGVACSYVARWSAASGWQPMGAGMDDSVNALGIHHGQLIAGGFFLSAGGVPACSIASWAGSSWRGLASDMDNGVHTLTTYRNELIAGGEFTSAGGQPVAYLARWSCDRPGDLNCDGALDGYDIDPFVLALTNPELYAATYADCDYMLADINGDGAVNGYDIDPFVQCLTGGECP
jgi:hypothetical protein